MSNTVLPVVPEVGDTVEIRYKSRRSRDGDGYNVRGRSGEVERIVSFHDSNGDTGHHILVREDPTTYLVTSVPPSGASRYAYSVNYDDGDEDTLQVSEFYDDGGSWTLAWVRGDKTQRVELGRTVEIRLRSVC